MSGILIFILKLIGWLLLALLCLVVFVAVLLLFVPIPYRLRLLAEDGRPPQFSARVFGFLVFPRREKRSKKKKVSVAAEDTSEDEISIGEDMEQEAARASDESAGQSAEKKASTEKKEIEKKQTEKKKKEKNKTGRGFGKQMLSGIRRELNDTGNRRAASHVFREAAYLLKHFGPRRVKGELSFSMGDPSYTGYATAAISLCPFAYSGCEIYPDFAAEKLYVLGELDVRGHVRLIHALHSGLGLLLDKDIRKLIHKLRKA
jgi:hypothetical protein